MLRIVEEVIDEIEMPMPSKSQRNGWIKR